MERLGLKSIKLKASLNGEGFYLKMGYKRSTGRRNFKGLIIQPMKKIF